VGYQQFCKAIKQRVLAQLHESICGVRSTAALILNLNPRYSWISDRCTPLKKHNYELIRTRDILWTSWRRDYLFPLPEIEILILQPVKEISISVNSLRSASLADDCHTIQTRSKLSPSGSQKVDTIFCCAGLALVPRWNELLNCNGHYVEVRCVPCATFTSEFQKCCGHQGDCWNFLVLLIASGWRLDTDNPKKITDYRSMKMKSQFTTPFWVR